MKTKDCSLDSLILSFPSVAFPSRGFDQCLDKVTNRLELIGQLLQSLPLANLRGDRSDPEGRRHLFPK